MPRGKPLDGTRPGPGRPPGSVNKITRQIRDITEGLFDTTYWKNIRKRLHAGELHPAIEIRLLAYRYGEPPKVVKVSGSVSVEDKRPVLRQLPAEVLDAIDVEPAEAEQVH
jgi:hypothetical protein